ncbi:MAG TPA: tetratricopeptide repeat protein [Gemmatimonadaceae bacterium]
MTPARATSPVRPVREDHLGASTFIEKGWHLIAQGDFAGAEKSFITALNLAPSDTHARTLLAWAMMRQGRLEESLKILDEVLAQNSMNSLARATLGYVCMRKGMLREAHEHMSRASAQMSDPKAALYGCFYLGLLYGQQRDVIEAERYFRKTLSLAPNFIEAYYELGRTHWMVGDKAEALTVWKAGNGANRFSEWGKRCAAAIRLMQDGKDIPSFS